jgi:aldehyde:ferredoxin oxidoreductase
VAQGPLGGTLAPTSGRAVIVCRSPLTGIFLRSNVGGFFGPELKWAGWDMVTVRGQADRPVYIWIQDDKVEIREASHLWGKDTWETERMLREELGDPDIKTLKIGPAGENRCYTSAVIGDLGRAMGKGSAAALWGAKKLKAIAVRGTRGVSIARPKEMVDLARGLWDRFKQDPMYASHTKYGTNTWVGDVVMKSIMGKVPDNLSSEAFYKLYTRNLSCSGCALHCSHFYDFKGTWGTSGEGLEGNTQMLGMDIGAGAEFVCWYNTFCNQQGMDCMHPGASMAWAIELYRDGIITKADTDGIELVRGNDAGFAELFRKMVRREGFGEILDLYPTRAAEKLGRGSELYISQRKGYPSMINGMLSSVKTTLAHAVATRGHDHLTGSPGIEAPNRQPEMTTAVLEQAGQEKYGDPNMFTEVDWTYKPKYARRVYDTEDAFAIADMTGTCKFAAGEVLFLRGLNLDDYARLMTVATGMDFARQDMVDAADREFARERAYNARLGIRRLDDYPYPYWWLLKYGQPHPRVNPARVKITKEDYDKLLDEYYRLRGCDLSTGIPTRATLERFGLRDIADDLARHGDLPG